MRDTTYNSNKHNWHSEDFTEESPDYVQINKQYINKIIYYKSLL